MNENRSSIADVHERAPASMARSAGPRERQLWIAAVSVLSTTTAWLAVLTIALLARSAAPPAARALLIVGRALYGAARAAGLEILGVVLLSGIVALGLAAALHGRASVGNGVRHA